MTSYVKKRKPNASNTEVGRLISFCEKQKSVGILRNVLVKEPDQPYKDVLDWESFINIYRSFNNRSLLI